MGRVPIGSPSGHTGLMSETNPALKLWHLTARFVTSLPPTPPSVDDEVWVDEHLLPGERTLWVRLSNQDRRHSASVAQRFVRARPAATRAEIAGAIRLSVFEGGHLLPLTHIDAVLRAILLPFPELRP